MRAGVSGVGLLSCDVTVTKQTVHTSSHSPFVVVNPLLGTLETPPTFDATNDGGKQLEVAFEYSDVLWPWSGHLALAITVRTAAADYDGIATGIVRFTVTSPPPQGEREPRTSLVEVPLRVRIIPTPAR